MRKIARHHAFIGAVLAIMIDSSAAAAALTGTWSGDRMNLTADAAGIRLEADCASGSIAAPIRVDAKGRFRAAGQFEQFQPGPQLVDESGKGNPARFSGAIAGDRLVLTVERSGMPRQTYTLLKGRTAKLVRCL